MPAAARTHTYSSQIQSRSLTRDFLNRRLRGRPAGRALHPKKGKTMNEKLNVRLGNPLVMFYWASAMFLSGIFVGIHWHPSHALTLAVALAAGAFTMLHELVCCFVWCSISAWWIGSRMGELKGGR